MCVNLEPRILLISLLQDVLHLNLFLSSGFDPGSQLASLNDILGNYPLFLNLDIYVRSNWIINKCIYTVSFKAILYLIREENAIMVT